MTETSNCKSVVGPLGNRKRQGPSRMGSFTVERDGHQGTDHRKRSDPDDLQQPGTNPKEARHHFGMDHQRCSADEMNSHAEADD